MKQIYQVDHLFDVMQRVLKMQQKKKSAAIAGAPVVKAADIKATFKAGDFIRLIRPCNHIKTSLDLQSIVLVADVKEDEISLCISKDSLLVKVPLDQHFCDSFDLWRPRYGDYVFDLNDGMRRVMLGRQTDVRTWTAIYVVDSQTVKTSVDINRCVPCP